MPQKENHQALLSLVVRDCNSPTGLVEHADQGLLYAILSGFVTISVIAHSQVPWNMQIILGPNDLNSQSWDKIQWIWWNQLYLIHFWAKKYDLGLVLKVLVFESLPYLCSSGGKRKIAGWREDQIGSGKGPGWGYWGLERGWSGHGQTGRMGKGCTEAWEWPCPPFKITCALDCKIT